MNVARRFREMGVTNMRYPFKETGFSTATGRWLENCLEAGAAIAGRVNKERVRHGF
jgi:hypothetical protein